VVYCTLWKCKYVLKMPSASAKSPTRFTKSAFIADLFACIRVCQKLINTNDASATPSQPTNICTRLSADTNTSMKKVKSDRYDRKRGRCGSSCIYEREYRCTHVLISVTTLNITTVRLSNNKPQDASYGNQSAR
jgi:hypothetical protein